jgi:hypothetical protein
MNAPVSKKNCRQLLKEMKNIFFPQTYDMMKLYSGG